ncbi:ComF family protein [Levilactobacillus namurensis]|uniref:ComF family protein n=1 Tax=Levilactobacillus namurensis TaxID=380393 RepID=A0AAW8W680_9LACO|nr:double zinc ribbon domain-containing protein [Levilactobacillus namurensis]MDT7015047.1 ComF family protein [Levilactobacillus namurensis]
MRPGCVWCGRHFQPQVSLADLLRWAPLPQPKVCVTCAQRLQPITEPRCPACGRAQATATICYDCERWGDDFTNHALFPYDANLKAYMQQYKFQGDYRLREVMQPILRRALAREVYDVLVPIPVAAETWQIRGFNQVTAWLTDQPYQQALVVREATKSRPQSSKTRQERLQAQQPFQLAPNAATVLQNQRVLLLDDVYTTGRTIRHAAQQIYLGGAKTVTSLTLAR